MEKTKLLVGYIFNGQVKSCEFTIQDEKKINEKLIKEMEETIKDVITKNAEKNEYMSFLKTMGVNDFKVEIFSVTRLEK